MNISDPMVKLQYVGKILERIKDRLDDSQNSESTLGQGRTTPKIEQVRIGGGRQYLLSVLFLDICSFTSWPNSGFTQQAEILEVMNHFMAEMMNIVRDFNGLFEKNTGDGLMAHFGTEQELRDQCVLDSVNCALMMHFVNDTILSKIFSSRVPWPIRFRTGIDFGPVTIGRVGIPGGLNSFVAIGSTANIACRILDNSSITNGGICLGNDVATRLPPELQRYCVQTTPNTGHVYETNQTPYPVWNLTYRLT